eukprot:scaffold778_cov263-Pinguiococcus_pyrenoidosus.AAC.15
MHLYLLQFNLRFKRLENHQVFAVFATCFRPLDHTVLWPRHRRGAVPKAAQKECLWRPLAGGFSWRHRHDDFCGVSRALVGTSAVLLLRAGERYAMDRLCAGERSGGQLLRRARDARGPVRGILERFVRPRHAAGLLSHGSAGPKNGNSTTIVISAPKEMGG